MLRLQVLSLLVSASVAALMPGYHSNNTETQTNKVRLTSMQTGGGLVADDPVPLKKPEVTKLDFRGAGYDDDSDSWGSKVDRRLDELERKVAACPCSNGVEAKSAGATTVKEAVVRSDMKPQEVADQLTKLGFKSTASPTVTTWQTSSYAASRQPETTYWVPQAVPMKSAVSRFRSNQTCSQVLVNGRWMQVCN